MSIIIKFELVQLSHCMNNTFLYTIHNTQLDRLYYHKYIRGLKIDILHFSTSTNFFFLFYFIYLFICIHWKLLLLMEIQFLSYLHCEHKHIGIYKMKSYVNKFCLSIYLFCANWKKKLYSTVQRNSMFFDLKSCINLKKSVSCQVNFFLCTVIAGRGTEISIKCDKQDVTSLIFVVF